MFPPAGRRGFLQALLGGATGLSLAGLWEDSAAAQEGPGHAPAPSRRATDGAKTKAALAATRLTERLILITGAGGNVVAVIGPDGLAMVNGGQSAHSAALLKFVGEQAPGKHITTLFNTDWYPDYTGSNEALGKAGATIIAHENTKQY